MQRSGRDFHRFDGEYVQRLRDGDPDTERHFVSYFKDLLRIKLHARLRSRQLAEDACQETFLRIFKTLRSGAEIREPERFGAYVNTVCDHVLLELYRSEKRHRPVSDAAVAEIEDETPVVEDRLVSIERRALVRQVIDDLPELDRRLMRALFVEERDKDEVCTAFKVDRSYLRVLLHRAKLRFRALYLARTDATSRNG